MDMSIKKMVEEKIDECSQPMKCSFCGKDYVPTKISVCGRERTVYSAACNCYEEKQKQKEKEQREEALRRKYERANIGKRYIDITLDELERLGTENVAAVKSYIVRFDSDNGKSLHLIGEFGNGKTSVGYAALKELIKKGFNGIYITWTDIVNRCYYARSFSSKETVGEILNDLSRFDIIVLDEFVIDTKDEKEVNLATELFDRLYRDNRCFILINNPCDIKAMKTVERLGKLLDRVREQAKILKFSHASYRRGEN